MLCPPGLYTCDVVHNHIIVTFARVTLHSSYRNIVSFSESEPQVLPHVIACTTRLRATSILNPPPPPLIAPLEGHYHPSYATVPAFYSQGDHPRIREMGSLRYIKLRTVSFDNLSFLHCQRHLYGVVQFRALSCHLLTIDCPALPFPAGRKEDIHVYPIILVYCYYLWILCVKIGENTKHVLTIVQKKQMENGRVV